MPEILDAVSQSHGSSRSHGMSGKGLLTSIAISIGIFLAQFTAFCVVRPYFQPWRPQGRSSNEDTRQPSRALPGGRLNWIKTVWSTPLESILNHAGLDAYFFMKFIVFLCLYLGILAVFHVPILVPIHATGGAHALGFLDRLTIANISSENSQRYTAHMVVCAVTLVISVLMFNIELSSYQQTRAKHIVRYDHPFQNKTLLIKGVYPEFRSQPALEMYFGNLQSHISHIWWGRDYGDLEELVLRQRELTQTLERLITELAMKCIGDPKFGDTSPTLGEKWALHILPSQLPTTGYWKPKSITALKIELDSVNSQLELLQRRPELYETTNSCFVLFDSRISCAMAAHSINTTTFNRVTPGPVVTDQVHPKDMIWSNLRTPIWRDMLFQGISVSLGYSIIFGWAIPMAILSMLTQVEYLVQFVPTLDWLMMFPGISKLINGYLSPLLLSFLTSQVPRIFRALARLKGYPTNTMVEMDVQNYLFVFLFVQLFLIVTLATGLPNLAMRMVLNTSEGAITLASSLPKATSFFTSYLIANALTTCGSTFLKPGAVLKELWNRRKVQSARDRVRRSGLRSNLQWGSAFPLVTNLASIAITYSLVSPLILVSALIGLSTLFFAFKYHITFHLEQRSENDGSFFPKAIFQLFSGLYCGQVSLLGTLLLAQMPVHSILTVVFILITIGAQHQLSRRYLDAQSRIPLEPLAAQGPGNASPYAVFRPANWLDGSPNGASIVSEDISTLTWTSAPPDFTGKLSFEHPALISTRPDLWLPDDANGVVADQATSMAESYPNIGVTVSGAEIDRQGRVIVRRIPASSTRIVVKYCQLHTWSVV